MAWYVPVNFYFCQLNPKSINMRISLLLVLAVLIAAPFTADAQKASKKEKKKSSSYTMPKLVNNTDTISYIIGADISKNFKSNGIDVNFEILYKGMVDGNKGNDTLFSEDQIREIMTAWNQRMYQDKMNKDQQESTTNRQKGMAFLAENKKDPAVKETGSGLQYKIIKEGEGNSPTETDVVEVNYTGKLIDGTIFDSTVKHGQPAEFALNAVIPGWTEGLKLMKPGAVYMFFIPPDLGYGDQKMGPIPAGSTLIFEVELLEIDTK